jgi:hypothetical protein
MDTRSKRNGLSYFEITAVNEDLGGNLWLGTNSAGVMKLTRGGFSTYGEQDGIETVNHVFEDRAGNLAFRGNVLGDVRTSVFEGARHAARAFNGRAGLGDARHPAGGNSSAPRSAATRHTTWGVGPIHCHRTASLRLTLRICGS